MKQVPFIIGGVLMIPLAFAVVCSTSEKTSAQQQRAVQVVNGVEAFTRLVETSGDKLLMFDLYADWCMPCRILSPLVESIAQEHRDRVLVYKVDIDKNPEIARALDVQGIPFVVFVKNKQVVQAFVGVQQKDAYVRAILHHGHGTPADDKDKADGELVNGVRIIRLTTATSPGNIYVYRGEEVRLVVEKVDVPYSIHIPAFSIAQEATIGKDLEVGFKAGETGVFPLFCNGKCPAGDGQRFGRIVVLEYEGSPGKGKFKSISAKQAMEYIDKEKPFILDVRTPQEFYEGFIPGSKLIPLGQLADRVGEIATRKNRPVLVYCRSGNRSIAASQILLRNGFKKVYNMRGGIKAWKKARGQVEK
jgi:phage shock protein E